MSTKHVRPLIFGEVLFDHFPDGSVVLGGAPFNVAWHLHAFGLKPLMVSRVGDDELGNKVESTMRNWGMDCSGIQRDPVHPTGTVEVQIKDGEPTYEIVENVAYDFIDVSLLPKLTGSWLLYHGSLALRHKPSEATLIKLKAMNSPCFVDINLRSPWWRHDKIHAMINGATWLKLNDSELTEIYPQEKNQTTQIKTLSTVVSKQVILTSGEKGARVIDTFDGNQYAVVPEQASSVMDTVGAGDAFCSVFVAGLLLDWPLDISLQRAQAFASAIVGIRGATSQDRAFYQQFTQAWGLKD